MTTPLTSDSVAFARFRQADPPGIGDTARSGWILFRLLDSPTKANEPFRYTRSMGLEVAYWVALGVGAGFLVLSILLGDALDVFDFDLGDGVAATPVLFTAIAAFGGGGLLALKTTDISQGRSVLVGLASAFVLGGLAFLFFRVLGRQEGEGAFSAGQLVGLEGRCTVAIPAGRTGRVSVHHQGMTRSFTATSEQEIGSGGEIVVLEALGNTLKVARR